MSPEHRKAAGTRPVSRSDRLMKNAFGIGVLVRIVYDAKPKTWSEVTSVSSPRAAQVALGTLITALTLALGVWIMTKEIRLRPLPELPESVRQLRRKDAP